MDYAKINIIISYLSNLILPFYKTVLLHILHQKMFSCTWVGISLVPNHLDLYCYNLEDYVCKTQMILWIYAINNSDWNSSNILLSVVSR